MSGSKTQETACWFGGPELLRERQAAWERYARWAAMNESFMSPSAAVAGVGFLYQLLAPESRKRPPDVQGVALMHRMLAVLEAC